MRTERMLRDPGDYLNGGIPEDCPAFIVLTRTQEAAVYGEGYLPPGTVPIPSNSPGSRRSPSEA